MEHTNTFTGYEYREVTVGRDMESVYTDAYLNFGWEPEASASLPGGPGRLSLKFKRDRKIRNKAELTRLQRQFESCAHEISALEKSKTRKASILAYTIGLVGCAFLAGSVFAVTAAVPNIALCIICAIPGFLGWILPYFCFCAVRRKQVQAVTPAIEKKYDEIYEVCEKGNGLLGRNSSENA